MSKEKLEEWLHQLTEFNPALVYCFDAESPPQKQTGKLTWEKQVYAVWGQHEDILNGYLYAQKIFLPLLKNGSMGPE